ncbi:hypothetical protein LER27_13860 [Pseudomonas aeruginosa]|uniref:hypothetical protein n=1 Tax=Pseudomonas aeruginosa TaxID=287 RepID=UPI001A1ECF08|nr:hypothetical protein [Pseudomonas aeruginosa]MBI7354313.1 hypothetical protein [Pseudomonas aeruginosa]MBI8948664.1 hypothetical protein [Pseudomonas aeruginosa]MDU0538044.1 hypothetical protein [Pseudomonas aeruginosa]HEJ4043558.1 hypothetical protein [Pseudomonas aeruginosa]HEJ5767235.1 hypothetical protein [Pseudomonas aeruginosa]
MEMPSTSNESWLGGTIAVSAFVFSLVGLAALVVKNVDALLALAAGASFTLAVALWVTTHRAKASFKKIESDLGTRLLELEIDLRESRRQASEWSATSNSIATAIQAMFELNSVAPVAPARKTRPRNQDDENDN